jgi:hypothetical protein
MSIRAVLRRVIELDSSARDDRAKREALIASLSEEELREPTVRWIKLYANHLDWVDNILDLATRYFDLPPKPLDPQELPGYWAAVEQFRAAHPSADGGDSLE